MKKIISILTIFVLCIAMVTPITVSAASASASFTGPGTVRAGDTITLSFNLNGSGIYGVQGVLSYDSNQVTLSGTTQKIGAPWLVEFNGNTIVAYDNNLSNPINSNKTLFTVTFKVKSVAPGTTIKISCSGVKASDGNALINVGTVVYSKTVAAPLSTNNNLKSLTVGNATISPNFSAGTTSYSVGTVEFDVNRLNINAVAEDPKAKVSVTGNNLAVGNNTVKVVVKAENGATKTYSIKVTRKQDPNYVPSSNTALSGMSVDGFLISPPFSSGVDNYIVWLPYETTAITARAAAADTKATISIAGGTDLVAGRDNTVTITCTAEDGTKKDYKIIAKRASKDGSEIKPEIKEESNKEANTDSTNKGKISGIKTSAVIALCVLFLLVGALVMFILIRFGFIPF